MIKGGGQNMSHYTKDLNEVIKGLKKASRLHAAQAKKLEKLNKDQKSRYTKPVKKKKVAKRK